jgi:hypothetical protein
VPLPSFEFSHSLLYLLLQHLSQGTVSVPTLQVEVTWVREAAAAAEAAHITEVLAMETSA